MQLPSNKVGLVLIGVVFVISATIFFSTFQKTPQIKDLQNVDLLVGRNTDQFKKSGDTDGDGLLDWQEELFRTDPQNPDTDGDGTPDGEEVALKRDPTVPGPNDPLLTTKDFLNTNFDSVLSATGTVTQKLSVDLASEYFLLKKNNELTPEKEAELISSIAQKAIVEAKIKNTYTSGDLISISSSKETVKLYGEEFARVSLEYYKIIDSYKYLSGSTYLNQISKKYIDLAKELSNISVPTVATEVHVRVINGLDQTGKLFQTLSDSGSDPIATMVQIGNQQKVADGDLELYTSLSGYFKENGIIFDDTDVIRFWNYFSI